MRLVESMEFTAQILEAKNTNGRMVVGGVFQRADLKNNNGRVYPKRLWERTLKDDKVLERIKHRMMVGELDHPADGKTSLKRTSHLITKLMMNEDGTVYGEAEILSTPNGQILESLIRDGVAVGISSRASGTIKKDGTVDEGTFELDTFDFVQNPSTAGAYPRPLTEDYNPDNADKQMQDFILEMRTDDLDLTHIPLAEELELLNKYHDRVKLASDYEKERPELTHLCEEVRELSRKTLDKMYEDIREKKVNGVKAIPGSVEDSKPAESKIQEQALPYKISNRCTINKVEVAEVDRIPKEHSIVVFSEDTLRVIKDCVRNQFFVESQNGKYFLVEKFRFFEDIVSSFANTEKSETVEEESLPEPDDGEEDILSEEEKSILEKALDRIDETHVVETVSDKLGKKLQERSIELEELKTKYTASLKIIESLMGKLNNLQDSQTRLDASYKLIEQMTDGLQESVKKNKASEKIIQTLMEKQQTTQFVKEEVAKVLQENPDLQKYRYILEKATTRQELDSIIEDLLDAKRSRVITEKVRPKIYTREPLPTAEAPKRFNEQQVARSFENRPDKRVQVSKMISRKLGGK